MTSDVIATDRKYRCRFATGGKLILFRHVLLSSMLVKNSVIVIKNRQTIFQLHLQLSTFENSQLKLQQNRVINYNFVNYNCNFSKPGYCMLALNLRRLHHLTLFTFSMSILSLARIDTDISNCTVFLYKKCIST